MKSSRSSSKDDRKMSWVRRIVRIKKARYCFAFFILLTVLGCLSTYILLLDSSTCQCSSSISPSLRETQQQLQEKTTRQSQNDASNDVNTDASPSRSKTNQSYKLRSLITTTSCIHHYPLLILVASAPTNVDRRSNIRLTWGVDSSIKPRWKTAFVMAQPRSQDESDVLLKESDMYGDILRIDYCNSYFSQTLTWQIGFEWATRYCNFSFLLRMYDDVAVNTMQMLTVLKDPNTPQARLYMGRVASNARPFRSGSYGVSKAEYSDQLYPPFCTGFAIVFSADVVALFVDLFDVVPPFKLDDVYMGIIAKKTGIDALHSDGFEARPRPEEKCTGMTERTLVRLGIVGECLFHLHKDTILNYA